MALIADKAAHDPIQSSWANTLRNQSLQVTTSAARPSSPTAGMQIFETDTGLVKIYDGSAWQTVHYTGAWTAFTAQFRSSFVTARTGTTNWGRYRKIGRTLEMAVHWTCTVNYGSAGSWTFDIPGGFTPAASGIALPVGEGYVYTGTDTIRCVVTLPGAAIAGVAFTATDTGSATYAGALNSGMTATFSATIECTT